MNFEEWFSTNFHPNVQHDVQIRFIAHLAWVAGVKALANKIGITVVPEAVGE